MNVQAIIIATKRAIRMIIFVDTELTILEQVDAASDNIKELHRRENSDNDEKSDNNRNYETERNNETDINNGNEEKENIEEIKEENDRKRNMGTSTKPWMTPKLSQTLI